MKKKLIPTIFAALVALMFLSAFQVNGGDKGNPLFLIYTDSKFGYIDDKGNMVIKPQFDEAGNFADGLAAVKIRDKWGFIDMSGNMVITPKYDKACRFMEGLACVEINGEWGFIDKKGNLVIEPKPDRTYFFYISEGMIMVQIDDKWGYMDKKGNIVIKPKYEGTMPFIEGLAEVRINDKYGFIDKKGRVVIEPKYDLANGFSEGLALVQIDGKYGFIDRKGKMVIEAQYENALWHTDGLVPVQMKNKWGFVDKKGQMVIKPQYEASGVFSEGLAQVCIDNKWGYIDKTGKMVIQPKFSKAYGFKNGLAEVAFNDFECAYIDKSGNVVFEFFQYHDPIFVESYQFDEDNVNLDAIEVFVEDLPSEFLVEVAESDDEDRIYTFVEEDATFPGGEEALVKFMDENLQYPEMAREANIAGTVVIKFVVEKDGSLTHLSILREIGGGCGKEALRVVRSMPKWNPAKQSGQVVRSEFVLPVLFK